MAGTATAHPHHFHMPALSRSTLRVGWPRRVAASLMIVVGAAFVAITLIANLFSVGPAFDRLTDGFRPIMTEEGIQTLESDIALYGTVGDEIQTSLMPALAKELGMTPEQFTTMVSEKYPAFATGVAAIPQVTQQYSATLTNLDENRDLFKSADAIPVGSVPTTSVPWALLIVGLLSVGLGVWVWMNPRVGAIVATVTGAALIGATFMFGLLGKTSDADQLVTNLKPTYTQQAVDQANAAQKAFNAMGTQMSMTMIPALAAQLQMNQAEMQAFMLENLPKTVAASEQMTASSTRVTGLVDTMETHLSDFNTIKPEKFQPVSWVLLIGGIALFVLGGTGILIMRGKGKEGAEAS